MGPWLDAQESICSPRIHFEWMPRAALQTSGIAPHKPLE